MEGTSWGPPLIYYLDEYQPQHQHHLVHQSFQSSTCTRTTVSL